MQAKQVAALVYVVGSVSFPNSGSCQNQVGAYTHRPIRAVSTPSPPIIDGDISDAAWKDAPRAESFLDLQSGGPTVDQTTAWILYDDKYIYVAFYAKESRPETITARETLRDYRFARGSFDQVSEDAVEVGFDPFRGHKVEDHSFFALNALGTRSLSLGGGRGGKREWKGDWDGAVKRVADGWTAEMRIPWAILNYPSGKQPVTFNLNFARAQSRTRIMSVWSNIGTQGFYELEGEWTGVQPPAGAFQRKLSLLPYTIPGVRGNTAILRSGVDARFTISPELTAVGTINPDFSTIEGAVEGIQFSRTERFVPERRPFFLEGGDFFNISMIDIVGQYWYSNRIPTFDVGTKLYGKIGPADTLGFLQTADFWQRYDTVARYRHDFTQTSSAGLFVTQKSARDDNNSVGVLTQNSRWGKLVLDSKWAWSSGRDAGGAAQELAFLYLDKQMFWAVGGANVAPDFRDANGLIGFTGYRGPIVQMGWSTEWRHGAWRSANFVVTGIHYWHLDGRPFQRGGNASLSFATRSDWELGLNASHNKFDDQTDETVGFSITSGASNRFRRYGIQVQTGTQGDRPSTFVAPTVSIRTLKKLDISYAGSILNLDGVAQQHIATIGYELSPSRSLGGRAVVSGADTNWYLSFRNSGEKGTETYVILGDPNARRFQREVRVKFVFAI